MEEREILQEAARRQDELESGVVRDLSYEELLAEIVIESDVVLPVTNGGMVGPGGRAAP